MAAAELVPRWVYRALTFAGSAEGAQRAATIYSLICTCGLLGVEPWAYLKDVLQHIAEGRDPAQLTPRLWQAARTQLAAS